jgi:hypothetical protein
MLRSTSDINGSILQAEDGEIGRCKDFLFDEKHWTVRYMLADTGTWLPDRKVLISAISLGKPVLGSNLLEVRLTREQIKGAPKLTEEATVSRKWEKEYHRHYGWPCYWGSTGIWGAGDNPNQLSTEKNDQPDPEETDNGVQCLRSTEEVAGYHIQASDGEIGYVEDFLLEDKTWTIRYMVVDTHKWLPGHKVLVSPAWSEWVDWESKKVGVSLRKEQIKNCPEYDPLTPVNREYEDLVYDHYGRPKYWI